MHIFGLLLMLMVAFSGLGYITLVLILMFKHVAECRKPFSYRDRVYQRPLSVIIPVKAPAPGLVRTLESLIAQDYDSSIEILVVFQDATNLEDQAEAQRVQALSNTLAEYGPLRQLRTVFSTEKLGLNPKNSNLIQGVRQTQHEWLYFCDADTRLQPDFFLKAMAAVAGDQNNFATAISFHTNMKDFGARVEAVGINFEMPAYFLLLQLQERRLALNGACMLINRHLLKRAGGFEITANTITDDLVLAAALRAIGGKSKLVKTLAFVDLEHESFGGFWKRFLRWTMIVKFYDQTLFWLAATSWHWLHLVWIGFVFDLPIAHTLAVTILLYRIFALWLFSWTVERNHGKLYSSLHMLIFDIFAPMIWIAALFSNSVVWAGQKLNVTKNGTLFAATKK